jgi:hypothetical protein
MARGLISTSAVGWLLRSNAGGRTIGQAILEGGSVDDRNWERWGALGGVVFAILVVISVVISGSPPKVTDSTAKMVKFINDKGDGLRWAAYLGAVAVVPFFWWLGSVWRLMRRGEGAPRLAVMAISGAVVGGVFAAVSGVMLGALPIIGTRTLGASGTRSFYVIGTNLGTAALFGIATFLLAFSALIIRTAVLPVILGWLGAVIGVVCLVGGAAVATTRDAVFAVALVGFATSLLWVLVVSVIMLTRRPNAVEVDTVVITEGPVT